MTWRPGISLLLILAWGCPAYGRAAEHHLKGQLSGWVNEARQGGTWRNHSGLRYIPELTLSYPVSDRTGLDMEVSLNGFLAAGEGAAEHENLNLYRLKLRFTTPQTETQIGLQKINFGPARLLRPQKWFDRLDPRDPLQLTDGVYALRFRYNTLNNAGLWLWCLLGNEDTKGYEAFATASGRPEFGGRIQYPLPRGEMAAAFHIRRARVPIFDSWDFTESRFALDGRWDVEIGLWFEASVRHRHAEWLFSKWSRRVTVGGDYTVGIGNGLYVLAEHMVTASSNAALEWGRDAHVSAFSVTYPIGYVDTFAAIGVYSWEGQAYWQHFNWRRTYDHLSLSVDAFSNSKGVTSGGLVSEQTPLSAGYGIQVVLIYNH